MRGRWILHPETGELVPAHEYVRPSDKRATCVPTPMLIRDAMDATVNPMDGRTYDSRSSYRRAVHARGGRIVGNDFGAEMPASAPNIKAIGVGEDVKRAYEQLGG